MVRLAKSWSRRFRKRVSSENYVFLLVMFLGVFYVSLVLSTWFLLFVFFSIGLPSKPMIRIRKLFEIMVLPVPKAKEIKREAKLAKGFMVIVKKKLNRDVLCRSVPFRKLMASVFEQDDSQEVWS